MERVISNCRRKLKEAMEATREAMEALRLEEEKYGKIPRF
jgi:hypothetical protein